MINYNEFYLTLVRHGESVINAQPDLLGQKSNVVLSKKGEQQAELLRQRLKFEKIDYVYSSTYVRAKQTAKIAINGDAHITEVAAIREYSAGDWIGANRKKTFTSDIINKMNVLGGKFLPPNGESLVQVERRASKWLEDKILYNKSYSKKAILNLKNKKMPNNIYCFSHGMTIKCLISYIMNFDISTAYKINIDNTSLSKFYFNSNTGWRLLCLNDCAHLNKQ